MAFQKKIWKDRISEFPTRRMLTKSDGSTELVDVSRAEGKVSQDGDPFKSDSMNDLEDRIDDEFSAINKSFSEICSEIVVSTPYSGTTTDTGSTLFSTPLIPKGRYLFFPTGYCSYYGAYNPGYKIICDHAQIVDILEDTTLDFIPPSSQNIVWTNYRVNAVRIGDITIQ